MKPRPGSLPLPASLLADLESHRLPLRPELNRRLASMLDHVETLHPRLFNKQEMDAANCLWTSIHVESYLGKKNLDNPPGDIDPDQVCIIGEAEPDSPIALDFRTSPPRVVYLGDIDKKLCWIELADSYESLRSALSFEN